ncbi:hypothetical protein [Bradyrhizobium sp. WSM2793]|uniref:hypothetical protein n=1 Tax=Bradyrhizobium sp. WSM2793 TaxID=1038866 RepID=UPI0012F91D2D|nr:hypothetical protein [Bradyrhizobium sp. WSM2793]
MAIVIQRPFLGSVPAELFHPSTCDFPPVLSASSSMYEALIINITLRRACDEKSRQILALSRRRDRVPCTIPALTGLMGARRKTDNRRAV